MQFADLKLFTRVTSVSLCWQIKLVWKCWEDRLKKFKDERFQEILISRNRMAHAWVLLLVKLCVPCYPQLYNRWEAQSLQDWYKIGTVSIEPWLWQRHLGLRQQNTMGAWCWVAAQNAAKSMHLKKEQKEIQTCSRTIMTTQWRLPLVPKLCNATWSRRTMCIWMWLTLLMQMLFLSIVSWTGGKWNGEQCDDDEFRTVWPCGLKLQYKQYIVIYINILFLTLSDFSDSDFALGNRACRIQLHSQWWKICQHQGAKKATSRLGDESGKKYLDIL